jgi:hypothetical protein
MATSSSKKKLSEKDTQALFKTLQTRFEKNKNRPKGIEWTNVRARLEKNPGKLWSLLQMEESGGEPDVVSLDKKTGELVFMDCAAESPSGRRSLCFDEKALAERRENKPGGSAEELAAEMGIEILSEEEYRDLQKLGDFDLKTSSWIQTPADIRKRGGALFCDKRYGHVFTYHNGAQSYYAARGFRGSLKV